ncbi:MAG: serine/threonine-protein kinase [Polyangiaceae bacterium]
MDDVSYKPGDILVNKYRVDRVLGVGGFGAVLAATHISLEERVAIKVLLPHAVKSPMASERFLREARAAVRIRSEHVARVSDVGQLPDGTPYMVMEYLEGQDLSQLVEAHGGQTVSDVAEWVLQACEALAEAHGLGIIHRDLKPANLFLTRKVDGSPCIKVLDFGISKLSSDSDVNKGMTKTSDVMGSPFYMSPEQMRSTRAVDARSDIWALGAVLFELLAGVTPFDAESMTSLVISIMQEPPRELTHYRQDIPPALRDVVLTCLEKDPARRFQDVGALAHALSGFAPARAFQHVQRVLAVSGRSSALPNSGGFGATVAASPTAPLAAPTMAQTYTPPAQPVAQSWGGTFAASRPAKTSSAPLIVGLLAVVLGLGAIGTFFFVTRSTNTAAATTRATADEETTAADPKPTVTATATASVTASSMPTNPAPSASVVVAASSDAPSDSPSSAPPGSSSVAVGVKQPLRTPVSASVSAPVTTGKKKGGLFDTPN